MSKQAFEAKLASLEALRPSSEAASALRKALKDRNNYVVSKAAALVCDLQLVDLTPDLLAAFERFFEDPVKMDPQCWAKTAIAKALRDLGYTEAAPFLRGIQHIQLEPVYARTLSDSAGVLRGTCALALLDCRLDDVMLLTYLVDALADGLASVRVDAAVALSRCGIPEAVAVLRLKARVGDEDAEVVGQCLHSLLQLAPRDYVGFVEEFLNREEAIRAEAASALAQCPEAAAWEAIQRLWAKMLTPEFREALRTFLAASPHREAAKALMGEAPASSKRS